MRFQKRTRILAAGGAVLLALLVGALVLFQPRDVRVLVDGAPLELRTRALSVASALSQAGLALAPGDQLQPAPDTWIWQAPQIQIERAAQITLLDGDDSRTLLTTARDPAAVLAEAGIALGPADRVLEDGTEITMSSPLSPGQSHVLQIRRAVTITLDEAGQSRTLQSGAATLGQALWQAGIRLEPADDLTPPAETALTGPLTASLRRARPITVQLADGQVSLDTAALSVGEALAQAGLALQGLDYSQPAEDRPLPADGAIRVVRVRENILVTQTTLPFETEYTLDDDTELDHERVVQEGQPGLVFTRERVRYEDGLETARMPESEWQAVASQNAIIGRGKKVVIRTEEINGVEIEYWRKLTVYATSYSPCRSGVDRCLNGTASGMQVQQGVVAVRVPWFLDMRGQPVFVPGYGKAVIGDTGGGIPGRYWIDLAYSDETYVSWHQWTTIYFLTPVPPFFPYIIYP